MPEPPDVDWLSEARPDGDPPPAGDTLELRGLPRWSRLVLALVVVAVIGAGVVALITHHRSPGSRAAPPTVTGRLPSLPTPDPPGALATDGTRLWVLYHGRIGLARSRGSDEFVRSAPATEFAPSAVAATTRLVHDPVGHLLWAYGLTGTNSVVGAWSDTTLERRMTLSLSPPVYDAAAYGGHLYASTRAGVYDVIPRGVRLIPGLGQARGGVAFDARRHRVLAIDLGVPTRLWSYRVGATRAMPAPEPLPFEGGTITVAGDAIWVSGHAEDSSIVERLDPATLRAAPQTAVGLKLGPGAIVISGGQRAIWVLTERGDLICADAGTGRARQSWAVPDTDSVITIDRTALATTDQRIVRLPLSTCGG